MVDKRSKVHRLPTKDKTDIILNTYINNTHKAKAIYHIKELMLTSIEDLKHLEDRGYKFQHLYFTTDEEIKKGDYIIDDNGVFGPWEAGDVMIGKHKGVIVSTTDESLGLPQPSQAFIEKYCKVGGIDEVMLEYVEIKTGDTGNGYYFKLILNIDLKHNTITIHPIKDSWNREEYELGLRKAFDAGFDYAQATSEDVPDEDEWINKNL